MSSLHSRTGRMWQTITVKKAPGSGRWSSLTLLQDLRALCSKLERKSQLVSAHRGGVAM